MYEQLTTYQSRVST